LRGTTTGTTFFDETLTGFSTLLFKVRAIKADNTVSAYSPINAAMGLTFTSDDPISLCGPLIKAVHITELRTAVNTARASVGLGASSFTDPSLSTGSVIKAIHVTELRTALSGFLSAIGVTPSYTDLTITPGATVVKGVHIQELRNVID
jgi:hypothetical protein